jgi:hypothetical protein
MTIVDFNIRKKKVISTINNLDGSNLKKLETYLDKLISKPCQFSVEEVIKRIELGEEEIEQGSGISVKELRKLHPSSIGK